MGTGSTLKNYGEKELLDESNSLRLLGKAEERSSGGTARVCPVEKLAIRGQA